MAKEKSTTDDFRKLIIKEFGKDRVYDLPEKVEVYPTGILPLNYALGIGGCPQGKVVEIFGPESGGKSLITSLMIAELQRTQGLPSAYLDVEHSVSKEWLEKLGVSTKENDLLLLKPETGEEGFEIIEKAIEANIFGYIVVDSVVGLVPEVELEAHMGDRHVSTAARMMSQGLKKIISKLAHSKSCLIMINQLRDLIGAGMYAEQETTPGGRALKFLACQRWRVSRSDKIKDGDSIIGHWVKVFIKKNKLGPPMRTASFPLLYTKGLDKISLLFELGAKLELINRSGSKYIYKSIETIGQDSFLESLIEDSKLVEELEKEITEKAKENPSLVTG